MARDEQWPTLTQSEKEKIFNEKLYNKLFEIYSSLDRINVFEPQRLSPELIQKLDCDVLDLEKLAKAIGQLTTAEALTLLHTDFSSLLRYPTNTSSERFTVIVGRIFYGLKIALLLMHRP